MKGETPIIWFQIWPSSTLPESGNRASASIHRRFVNFFLEVTLDLLDIFHFLWGLSIKIHGLILEPQKELNLFMMNSICNSFTAWLNQSEPDPI